MKHVEERNYFGLVERVFSLEFILIYKDTCDKSSMFIFLVTHVLWYVPYINEHSCRINVFW